MTQLTPTDKTVEEKISGGALRNVNVEMIIYVPK